MSQNYSYANDDEIEVRIDLEQSASQIQYRILSDDTETWHGTPFQRADVRFEDDALSTINAWLDTA